MLAANDFEVPEGSVNSEEAFKLQQDMESRMEQQGMPTNSKGKFPAEMFQEEASRRVKLGFIN